MNIPAPELLELFGLPAPSIGPDLQPRYNIAPTQTVPVVRQRPHGAGRELALARWGLIPSWAKDAKIGHSLINARSEGIASKPSFRSAFRKRRCLVPAGGFYEWKGAQAPKQPFCIGLAAGRPFAYAGLWEQCLLDGEAIDSCAIITTDANALMAEVHNRMPVILARRVAPCHEGPCPAAAISRALSSCGSLPPANGSSSPTSTPGATPAPSSRRPSTRTSATAR
jgi:putative SOS response-associated peptidase YedK